MMCISGKKKKNVKSLFFWVEVFWWLGENGGERGGRENDVRSEKS